MDSISTFNKTVLAEVGLDIDKMNRIIDQDTGDAISISGKQLTVAPNIYRGAKMIQYDPENNPKQMRSLFNYYLGKLEEEGEPTGINVFFTSDQNAEGKAKLECRDDQNQTISSNEYVNDSLRYLDIIMQLNGEKKDLSAFDVSKEEYYSRNQRNQQYKK